jgi:hypothetical protein
MMNDDNGVIEDSPSLDQEMVSSLEQDSVTEDSQSQPAQEGDGPDADNVEAKAEDESQDETEAAEEMVPKKSFLRRINGLQAARKRVESRASELEDQLAEYKQGFEIMQRRLLETEDKLRVFDEPDPRDEEIRRLKAQDQEREIRSKLDSEASQRRRQSETQRAVEARAEEIIEEAQTLAEEYPTVTAEELVLRFQKSDTKTMKTIAKEIDSQRVSHYKARLARQHGGPTAPRPVSSQGAAAPIEGHSADDMVTFLESIGR